MKHWLQFLAVLVMVVIAGISPREVSAAPSVGSASTANTTRIINDIIRRTPGITSRTTTGTGVTVAARGVTDVAAGRGLTIPIPTGASAAVSAGRIAGIAARAVRWGSFAGIASMVLPWLAERSGIVTCPPPDFFCKPGSEEGVDPISGGWTVPDSFSSPTRQIKAGTNVAACEKLQLAQRTFQPTMTSYWGGWQAITAGGSHYCASTNQPNTRFGLTPAPATCPDGSTKKNGTDCVIVGPLRPATEPEIGAGIEDAITGNPTRVGQAYDAINNAGVAVFSPADPVVVEPSAPVSAPQKMTVTQQSKPDGSIDTQVTVIETVVKPKVDGNTIGDTKITYPTTTTTTTKTTNNVTNITTTTTTVTNTTYPPVNSPLPEKPIVDYPDSPASPATPTEKTEFPTDYNREVTQKSILSKLEEFMKPITTTLPDGNAEVESVQAKNEEGLGVVAGITPETVNVKNWFPSVPTAACVDPQVPVPLGGGTVIFPICGYVNTFSNLISGVIAFFCILGCVHQVQSALKA